MNYRLYTIFDKIADEAGPIFMANNDEVAKRQFKNTMVAKGQNEARILPDPEEYSLVFVGTYDTTRMIIKGNERPTILNLDYGDKRNEDATI